MAFQRTSPSSEGYADQAFKPRRSFDKGKGGDVLSRIESKLDEVNKGYLAFFQERIRIEETYISSLRKLYASSRAFDSLYDDSLPHAIPTSRAAWREVRDHTDREAECRQAFVEAMQETVIRVFGDIVKEQGRIRLRIKEDLKMATDMYNEHAEKEVPKLKKAYFKKCAEVEEQKRQDHAIEMQAKLLADPINPNNISPSTTPLHDTPFQPIYPTPNIGPPVFSDPLPPSSNPALVPPPSAYKETPNVKPTGRNRSGSASQQFLAGGEKSRDVLNDLALQGKRGINAFISRLGGDKDRGGGDESQLVAGSPPKTSGFSHTHTKTFGGVGGGGGGGASAGAVPGGHGNNPMNAKPSALKGVKLRREAEEADKAYREAVFHLESLRLRKNKILVAANNSLDLFTEELCDKLRICLTTYVDCLLATSSVCVQLSEHSRKAAETIDTSADLVTFRGPSVTRNSSFAAPVLYENFYVGQCKSLLFGVSLNDYDYQRGNGISHGEPPLIVRKCIAELDKRGLDVEGIHRISGRQASAQTLMHSIEQDEAIFNFSDKDDIHCVSAILKSYCRQLPEPVFNFPLPERLRYTSNRETHISSNFSAIRARLSRMPDIHQNTLRAIIEHLGKVAAKAEINKMTAKNLAVVFGKALFGEDELPKDGDLSSYSFGKDTALEDFITFADLLYGEESSSAPGVLPAGAALSRAGSLSYQPSTKGIGSGRTKIKLPSSSSSSSDPVGEEPTLDLFRASPVPPAPPALPPRPADGPHTSPISPLDTALPVRKPTDDSIQRTPSAAYEGSEARTAIVGPSTGSDQTELAKLTSETEEAVEEKEEVFEDAHEPVVTATVESRKA